MVIYDDEIEKRGLRDKDKTKLSRVNQGQIAARKRRNRDRKNEQHIDAQLLKSDEAYRNPFILVTLMIEKLVLGGDSSAHALLYAVVHEDGRQKIYVRWAHADN